MKKMLFELLFIVIATVVLFILLKKPNSNRIEITNMGNEVIEMKSDTSESKLLLGPDSTGYFDRDSKIQIGDTTIRVGQRIEIENTGSDTIQVTYNNTEGIEQTMLLGPGEIGYVNKSVPFKIGDTNILIRDAL